MTSEEPSLLCASGSEKCLQPWAQLDDSWTCYRCQKAMHPLCAAIDASKASEGQFQNPESIRICYQCLHLGESPNNLGMVLLSGESSPTTKAKVGEAQSIEDLDWETLSKPHPSIAELIENKKVVAPGARKKTIWWRLFHPWNMEAFPDEVKSFVAYCNICGKRVPMSKADRSPTPLRRHLMVHRDIFERLNEERIRTGRCLRRPATSSPGTESKSQLAQKQAKGSHYKTARLHSVGQWILDTDQPLEVVETKSFRSMCLAFAGSFRSYTAFDKTDIEQYIMALTEEMRAKMKELLTDQSMVHVREYWKSLGRSSYQVDRVQWIDDSFELQSLVVACHSDTTVASGEHANGLWQGLGVSADKQVQFTVSTITSQDPHARSFGPKVYHGVENELNQIAKLAYEALGPNTELVVKKARSLVESITSSPATKEFLLKAPTELSIFFPVDQEPLPLIVDILSEYWWSTNEMIGRLIDLRKALDYLTLDPKFEDDFEMLTKQEWDTLENLQAAWEPFSIASQLLQKQKYVSVGLVPMILQVAGEDLIPSMYTGPLNTCFSDMLAYWEEKYGKNFPSEPFKGVPKAIWIGHALDPRFKSLELFASTATPSKDVIFATLLEEMISIKMQTTNRGVASSSIMKTSSDTSSGLRALASSRMSGKKRGLDRLSERLSGGAKTCKPTDVSSAARAEAKEECEAELQAYRAVAGIDVWTEQEDGSKDFIDPLPWWKQHHSEFPTLWKLARRFLAIPAGCAATERAFDAEAFADLAKRCELQQVNTNPDLQLLKENLALVDSDSYEGMEDGTKSATKSAEGEGDDGNDDEASE